MFKFKLEKKIGNKLYIQLFEEIKNMIENGEFKKDQKLPTIRRGSKILGVNPSTIVKAYDLLETRGYLYKVAGSGSYVAVNKLYKSFIQKDKKGRVNISSFDVGGAINLASATPSSELFPLQKFKESINYVLDRDGGDVFSYQDPKGYEPLRKEISKYLHEEGIVSDYEKIQVVSGSQQAIDITSKMLITPGDKVIVEGPTYLGAVSLFKKYGAHIISIPMEKDGIDTKKLETYLKKEGNIKFIYTMINYHNPTGICWSIQKKRRLLELSEKYGFYILEDECMSEIYYNSKKKCQSLKSLEKNIGSEEKIIYIKSFSKIFMPGLRLAFMLLPETMVETATDLKYMSDISSSGLNQRAFHYYLEEGYIDEHLKKVRKILKKRYALMKLQLQKIKKIEIFYDNEGGLFFWIKLPEWMNGEQLYRKALEKGVAFLPGSMFYYRGEADNCVRMSFAGVSIDEIQQGIDIFSQCIDEYLDINKTVPLL